LCGAGPRDATSSCKPARRAAISAAVSGDGIQIGDRVVHLQVPGVFTVIGRRGGFLQVEGARGLRMTIHQTGVRRVEGTPPVPKDT
jgi:hypothetical protein